MAQVAYSVQAFDWSGSKCREKERDSVQQNITLIQNRDYNPKFIQIVQYLLLCTKIRDKSTKKSKDYCKMFPFKLSLGFTDYTVPDRC